MTETDRDRPSSAESDGDRLRGLLAPDALSVDLVSALAGDRPVTPNEEETVRDLSTRRGDKFFSDLLYAITHQFFPPESAETLWQAILQHKIEMSKALKRNIKITVATLDYLSNLEGEMEFPTLITEARIGEIANLSMRDGLTGLFNHTSCLEILDLEMRSCQRYGNPVSVIMIDVDDFKQVNDLHGHPEGDRILLELARMMESTTRDCDICCRYGGEEFAVILPHAVIKGASAIAQRICLEAQCVYAGESPVSVSCGVAVCGEEAATSHALIAKADRGLYLAKRSGKNRVEVEA